MNLSIDALMLTRVWPYCISTSKVIVRRYLPEVCQRVRTVKNITDLLDSIVVAFDKQPGKHFGVPFKYISFERWHMIGFISP